MDFMGEETGRPNEPQPTDDEYPVLPPDPERVDYKPTLEPFDLDELLEANVADEARFQFSLAELLLLTAMASLILGILGCFPRQYAAGLAGLGALISLIVLAVLKPQRPVIYLGWWVILGIYLLSCVAAMIPES
jgi:lipopolysaccharide export LptBFGC system permease protein LptF